MKKILILILLFPLLLYSQDKYKKAIETKESTTYLIEIGNYKAWAKTVTKIKKIKLKNGKYNIIGGSYVVQLISCNCSDKKISTGRTIKYNKNGEVLEDYSYDSPYEYVVPETIGENILNIVCGWDDYAIDIELKKLYLEYSKYNDIYEEIFLNTYNALGEEYLSIVRKDILNNKKR